MIRQRPIRRADLRKTCEARVSVRSLGWREGDDRQVGAGIDEQCDRIKRHRPRYMPKLLPPIWWRRDLMKFSPRAKVGTGPFQCRNQPRPFRLVRCFRARAAEPGQDASDKTLPFDKQLLHRRLSQKDPKQIPTVVGVSSEITKDVGRARIPGHDVEPGADDIGGVWIERIEQ